ncbi:hypothetical protein NQ315_010582 [Exocentrus adspersus]|uniref:Uncharacterized protein n=1 Tax=Exocentrus adspersus TaxID=1586481 RepID=A0AAV8W5C0_9CUCU|nr:hypothetical protein NQ315_010582 [Exocentrus adspersus]
MWNDNRISSGVPFFSPKVFNVKPVPTPLKTLQAAKADFEVEAKQSIACDVNTSEHPKGLACNMEVWALDLSLTLYGLLMS